MARIAFLQVDRSRLHRLGLNTQQIDELERRALPICKAMLAPIPAMTEVRSALSVPLASTRVALRDLRGLRQSRFPAAKEARVRLDEAMSNDDGAAELLDSAIRDLNVLYETLGQAQGRLPKEQRRHRSADHRLVDRVAKALLDGFVKAYEPPFPPYKMKPSSSHNSNFYRIVSICFRTIGAGDNPERAIKEYIRINKERTARSRRAFGIDVD